MFSRKSVQQQLTRQSVITLLQSQRRIIHTPGFGSDFFGSINKSEMPKNTNVNAEKNKPAVHFDSSNYIPLIQGGVSKKEMILQTLDKVANLQGELNAVMSNDETEVYGVKVISPQEQLKKCLDVCKDKSPEDISLYLYTTYFYQPLNNFLRTNKKSSSKDVQKLIDIAGGILMEAFKNSKEEKKLSHFRMELRPSLWIKDKSVGDTLDFPAFTSTHPNFDGVNKTWGDIEGGAFGEYEQRLALLVFEGKSKLLRPEFKYFRKEVEDILPPGTMAKIMKKTETSWKSPQTHKTWIVDVYHLMTLPVTTDILVRKFEFEKDGYIYSK